MLYMLTAVDVRRAERAGSSRPIILAKLTMPALKFITASHTPGGSVMGAEFAMPRIEAPEPAFAVKGFDIDAFGGMGTRDRWVFAGSYRNKLTNRAEPGRAIIEGAIVEWEPDESDPEEFKGCNHVIREVTHYELLLNGEEMFYVDLWERVLRTGGTDLFAEDRRALGA